jgi:hypothetical protein
VQITRHPRKDGSTTFSLRQLLDKIELGQWTPQKREPGRGRHDEQPTVAELATDWLCSRELNPAITETTTDKNKSLLKRYLIPFFGELRRQRSPPAPSRSTATTSTSRTPRSARLQRTIGRYVTRKLDAPRGPCPTT